MRNLLFFLCLSFLSTVAFAQSSLGLRASYGFSDLLTDSELDAISEQFDNASSLSFGIIAEIPFGEVFSLRSGIELNRRGTTLTLGREANVFGAAVPFGAEAKTRFTYVDIPLLAQVNIPMGGAIQPYAFVGPSFGYATNGNVRTTTTAVVTFSLMTTGVDLDDIDYERFHVAAMGGLGVRAQLGEQLSAFIEGRYEQSLTEPYDVPLLEAQTGFKGVQFGAGFMLRL